MVHAVTLNFLMAGLAEFIASLGFDCVVIDGEHSPVGERHLEDVVRAAELGGITPLLRMPSRVSLFQAYLDTGFEGIQVPQVKSIEDVQRVVDVIKFAPIGTRGAGGGRVSRFGGLRQDADFAETMNDMSVVIVQIETREALDALSEIVSHPDVDVILAGPLDLSFSLGVAGELEHSRVIEAVDEIVARTVAEGKVAGLPYSTLNDAEAALDRGARFLLTSVTALLRAGAQELFPSS